MDINKKMEKVTKIEAVRRILSKEWSSAKCEDNEMYLDEKGFIVCKYKDCVIPLNLCDREVAIWSKGDTKYSVEELKSRIRELEKENERLRAELYTNRNVGTLDEMIKNDQFHTGIIYQNGDTQVLRLSHNRFYARSSKCKKFIEISREDLPKLPKGEYFIAI